MNKVDRWTYKKHLRIWTLKVNMIK